MRLVLSQGLRRLSDDRQFGFELPDSLAGSAQFCRLGGGIAGDLPTIDAVLLEPCVQASHTDAQFVSGLFDLFTGSNQRNSAGAELGG